MSESETRRKASLQIHTNGIRLMSLELKILGGHRWAPFERWFFDARGAGWLGSDGHFAEPILS